MGMICSSIFKNWPYLIDKPKSFVCVSGGFRTHSAVNFTDKRLYWDDDKKKGESVKGEIGQRFPKSGHHIDKQG